MMRVGNRHGESVSGIRAGDLYAGKKAHDHRVDLRLLGIADPDYGLLHQPRRIFADVEAGTSRGHDHHPARLPQLQRRLRVLVDEDFLDRGAVGPVVGDQRVELDG